jgi:PAS domain S-box-containing protein/diguanylate cyclase (GGDEF)-like protein
LSDHKFWRVLCINSTQKKCQKLYEFFDSFEFQDKKPSIAHCVEKVFFENLSTYANFQLIILTVTPARLENTKKILNALIGLYGNEPPPVIIDSDENIKDKLNSIDLEYYNVNGFIESNNFSSFNVKKLIEFSLKKQEVNGSQVALTNSTYLMTETEVLTLSGGWQWDIISEKLNWTKGVYFIHDLPICFCLTPDIAIDFYLPDDREIIEKAFEKLLLNEEPYDLTLTIKSFKGRIKTIRTTGKVKKEKGKLAHVYGSISDISEHTVMCQRIERKREFKHGILNGILDAVLVLDEKGNILEVNPASEKIFGFSKKELINENISKLIPQNKRITHQAYVDSYSKNGTSDIIGEHRAVYAQKANGKIFPVDITINKVKQQGRLIYISIVRNIEKRLAVEQQLQDLAYRDKVTKLANSKSFENEYAEQVAKYKLVDENVCFVQINIIQFFKINFAYGHRFGNKVLRYIAGLLTSIANKLNGRLYRISGICFMLMFSHKKSSDDIFITVKAEILHELLNKHHINDKFFDLTPVVTIYNEKAIDITKTARETITLLELCQQGRDKKSNLTLVDGLYLSRVNRELHIERKLKHAIDVNKGFHLLYQPQMNTKGALCSAEALVRLEDDEFGVVYPDEFIKVAERTGLIIPITKWIVNQCISDISKMIKEGIEIPISINISANHIVQSDFVNDILIPLEKEKVPSNLLMLELTESAFADDIDSTALNMIELNKKGINFSLDDFGTGYSNLVYLNQLPFNELKIDKAFIDNILTDDNQRSLVKIIISIGKVKNLKIVAEGVESVEQLEMLKDYGIDLIQGYYYSKPIEFNTLKNMLLH